MSHKSIKFALTLVLCMMLAFWAGHWRGKASVPTRTISNGQTVRGTLSPMPPTSVAPADEPDPATLVAELTTPAPALQPGDMAVAPARNFTRGEMAALTGNPALQDILATQQAVVLDLTYNFLFKRLRLSSEERDYFKNLLLERQMRLANLGMQLVNVSLTAEERAALGRQIEDGLLASNVKIRTFLNDEEDFAAYQAYTRQEPERLEVGMFAQSLGGLDPATAETLADLLGDSRRHHPFTVDFYDNSNFANPSALNAAAMDRFLDEQVRYQAAVADQAASFLSPAQLEAFRQNQTAVRQLMKMQLHGVLQMGGTAP